MPGSASHFGICSVATNSKYESELVPATVVVRFVDAHAVQEQADEERNWGMIPCQSPPQKPAGWAYASLYLEFEPATARAFAIGARNYRTTLTKSGNCTN